MVQINKNLFVFFGFVAAALVLVLIDIAVPTAVLAPPYKVLLFLVVIFLDLIAVSTRFYAYLIIPVFTQLRRHLVLSDEDPYWISTSSDSILHKEGDDFIATVYVKIPYYASATEMGDTEKFEYAQQVSRLVGLSREPVRFTSQMSIMNKDEYIQNLRNLAGETENELNAIETGEKQADPKRKEYLKGKLGMWNGMLDTASKTTSLELNLYAAVSGTGTKEFEAVGVAQQRARELMSGIAATFGVTPSLIVGNALISFVEPESQIPYSTVSEQISSSIREQIE